MTKSKSSRSNQSPLPEEKTQSDSKRTLVAAPTQKSGKSSRSNRSKKSKRASAEKLRTQKTQLAPPDDEKFDELKKEALKTRQTQITQIVQAKSMAKRETGFDKTQWELTKWAEEAAKPTDIAPKPNVLTSDVPMGLAPPNNAKTDAVPGENRQEEGEKGDYLNDRPTTSLIMNAGEILLCFVALILSNVGGGFTTAGVYITSINLILCLVGLGFLTFWQFRRMEVVMEETKQGTKYYYIKGCGKRFYWNLHYWRMILYFITFSILMYVALCSTTNGLILAGGILSLLCMALPITHIVYVKKGVFSIVTFWT